MLFGDLLILHVPAVPPVAIRAEFARQFARGWQRVRAGANTGGESWAAARSIVSAGVSVGGGALHAPREITRWGIELGRAFEAASGPGTAGGSEGCGGVGCGVRLGASGGAGRAFVDRPRPSIPRTTEFQRWPDAGTKRSIRKLSGTRCEENSRRSSLMSAGRLDQFFLHFFRRHGRVRCSHRAAFRKHTMRFKTINQRVNATKH